jgi:hypothetical protein
MHLGQIVFNICFAAAAVVIGACGALQSFWPAKLRSLRDKFPRGYNPDSPLGGMMDRARASEPSLLSRIRGLLLFCVMVFFLGWWFLGHPPLGR